MLSISRNQVLHHAAAAHRGVEREPISSRTPRWRFSGMRRDSAHHQFAVRALPGERVRRPEEDGAAAVVDSVATDFDLIDGPRCLHGGPAPSRKSSIWSRLCAPCNAGRPAAPIGTTGSPQGKETMSRIHDALSAPSRNERSTGTHVEPAYAQPEVQNESMPARQYWPTPGSPACRPYPWSLGLTYEALLARCAKPSGTGSAHHVVLWGQRSARGRRRVSQPAFASLSDPEKMPLKRLLITSALPKDGKSFTAAIWRR